MIDPRTKKMMREDGAIKLPSFLDEAALARCRECFDWSVSHPGSLSGYLELQYTDIANPKAVAVYEPMLRALPFVDFLAELWESEHVWFWGEELVGKEGGRVGRSVWHQDTAYTPFTGEHFANCWISFESLPRANSLEIVRGSHRDAPIYNTGFDQVLSDLDDGSVPQRHGSPSERMKDPRPDMPDIEAERRRDPTSWDVLSWDMEVGDVILFHPGVLHGGAPVDASCPNRHTLALRFFGDDVTYRPIPWDGAFVYELRAEDEPPLREGEPYRSSRFLQLR